MKRAIVDVDGILWNLYYPLTELLQKLYPETIGTDMSNWNWFLEYMTKEQFYAAVDIVHMTQINYPAFSGATELFNVLNQKEYEICVASHRAENTAHLLSKWLEINELKPYSMVYTGHNKKEFVERGCLVIDDSPITIDFALSKDCDVHYLAWPWNQDKRGNSWSDLYQLLGAINDGRN